MGRIFEALMREEGLSAIGSGEGRLVYLLWTNGPLRQGELAAKAGIDKSTLALTLARMERKGLVQRSKEEKDARVVTVSLGADAVAHGAAYERVSEKMGDLFYRGIPDADIMHFEAILKRILANLEEVDI
jgi:MarR family transcriptional regulator, organic hydroperoxide resistance regulator